MPNSLVTTTEENAEIKHDIFSARKYFPTRQTARDRKTVLPHKGLVDFETRWRNILRQYADVDVLFVPILVDEQPFRAAPRSVPSVGKYRTLLIEIGLGHHVSGLRWDFILWRLTSVSVAAGAFSARSFLTAAITAGSPISIRTKMVPNIS
jgi:hypothetical protein